MKKFVEHRGNTDGERVQIIENNHSDSYDDGFVYHAHQ